MTTIEDVLNEHSLIIPLYEEKYIQTLWNTNDPVKRAKGWTLKGGLWSPWFFNMRPVGDSPELFFEICSIMSNLIIGTGKKPGLLIGVEMAGLPLVGGISTVMRWEGFNQRFGYTRPLYKNPGEK